MSTQSSPDPLNLGTSDKENSGVAVVAGSGDSAIAPTTTATKATTATAFQRTSTTTTTTSRAKRTTTTAARRGKGAVAHAGTMQSSSIAGPSGSSYAATAGGPTSSPRRSTRARTRSISRDISVRGRGDASDGEDYNDDGASVASSSATATRRAAAGPAGTSTAYATSKRGQHQTTVEGREPAPSQQSTSQRGRGPSFIQQSEKPTEASFKDTSVNIATAFRQAAGVVGALNNAPSVTILANSGSATNTGSALLHHSQQSLISSSSTSAYRASTVANASAYTLPTASASNGNGSIGFLGRAGDRQVPLHNEERPVTPEPEDNASLREGSQNRHQSVSTSPEMSRSGSQQGASTTATSASKKRKGRASSSNNNHNSKSRSSSAKDTAWKPSKEELASMSTDEYTSEGAITTDPEDLTKYIENPWGKKVYTVEYEGGGRRHVRRRLRKRTKNGENDENEDEGDDIHDDEDDEEEEEILLDDYDIEENADATASPATRRKNATARRGRGATARRGRGRAANASTSRARQESIDESVLSTEAGGGAARGEEADAASQNGTHPVTSFYLHEPSAAAGARPSPGESSTSRARAQGQSGPSTQRPEFIPAQQAGLIQTYPKADNFQPYFAYSTTTLSAANGAGAAANKSGRFNVPPLRARRDTTASTSTSATGDAYNHTGGSGMNNTSNILGRGPSSTASFDQRGSEYDYAEEDRMTAALLAAKERGSTGKGIPEGRPILPDMLLTRNYGGTNDRWTHHQNNKDREMSLSAVSEQSSEIPPHPQAQSTRSHNGPAKRAPAPPPRDSSILTDSTSAATGNQAPPGKYASSATDYHNQYQKQEGEESFAEQQAKKSIARRLGEIVRALLVLLYYCVASPLSLAKKTDAGSLWKMAGAVLLIGLTIGSMYEQNTHLSPSKGTLWDRIPFLTSASQARTGSYHAPDNLPSNFDEVIQRLVNLEGSVRSLSVESTNQYTTSTRDLRDSHKRLAGLEADIESERRKTNKVHDALEKGRMQDAERVESTLKGIRNKLDSLNEVIKSHENERKTDSSDLLKLKNDVGKVHKDLEAYKGRMDMLVGKTDAALDRDRTVKLVREAIEEILPSRLAVNVDSKTGQVSVDPKFWQYLKTHFAGDANQAASASPSWEDFLNANSEKLRKMVEGDVASHLSKDIREGAILSKKTFAEALERELRSLNSQIQQSTSEQIAHLSSEVDGKIAKVGASHGSGKTIKLSSGQDVNTIVSSLIDEALTKYSKDILGKPDFALYSAGGRVIPSLTSPSYEIRPSSFAGSILGKLTGASKIRGKAPVIALHPDISTGQCWATNGPTGQIGIMLSRRIHPTEITIEHASKDVALDVSSAPRNFEVWAVIDDPAELQRLSLSEEIGLQDGENKIGNLVRLVKDAYDVEANNHIQTFEVDEQIDKLKLVTGAVVLKILDNHGNDSLSCLYRIRVGGQVV